MRRAFVLEDDYGLTYCETCKTVIECDENGDFPKRCPGCGGELDWTKWNEAQEALWT